MSEKKENNITISKGSITIIGILLAVIVCLLGYMVVGNSKNNTESTVISKTNADPNLIQGNTKEDAKAELAEAQRKVDEGMLAVEITSTPTFPSGTEVGKIMVQNPEKNTLDFTVQFVLDDTDEVVYTSGLIPVGSRVDDAKLDKDLDKGQYPATAFFTSYDSNGVPVGQTGLAITIIVQN